MKIALSSHDTYMTGPLELDSCALRDQIPFVQSLTGNIMDALSSLGMGKGRKHQDGEEHNGIVIHEVEI
jgi:hypothetical protein